jgi:type VI secretion system protein ImpG
MSGKLFDYFIDELEQFRSEATERFAARHKDVASRLLLHKDRCDDPHVEHLIQAFALIAARLRMKVDDEFGEVTDGLLSIVAPHLLRPRPASAVAQLDLNRPVTAMQSTGGFVPPRTTLEAERQGATFSTAWATTLPPFEVKEARFQARLPGEVLPEGVQADFTLRIRLEHVMNTAGSLAKCRLPSIRLFIDGQPLFAFGLLAHVCGSTRAMAWAPADESSREPLLIAKGPPRLVGFEPDESLFAGVVSEGSATPPRSLPGMQLFHDHAALPEKFRFIDIEKPGFERLGEPSRTATLIFYLDAPSAELQRQTSASTFRTGCVPVVNLFERTVSVEAPPTRLSHPIEPGPGAPPGCELHDILSVYGTWDDHDRRGGADRVEYRPLYGFRSFRESAPAAVWWASRRAIDREPTDLGARSIVDLHLSDHDRERWARPGHRIEVRGLWTNAGHAGVVPADPDRPLRVDGIGQCSSARLLTRIAPQAPALTRTNATTRLISIFNMHHFPFADGERAVHLLNDLLRLHHDPSIDGEDWARRLTIDAIETRPLTSRVIREGLACVVSGWGVRVVVDGDSHPWQLFMLGSIIDRFMGYLCPVNSFVQTSIRTSQSNRVVYQWPRRTGSQIIP